MFLPRAPAPSNHVISLLEDRSDNQLNHINVTAPVTSKVQP